MMQMVGTRTTRKVLTIGVLLVATASVFTACSPRDPHVQSAYMLNTERMSRNITPLKWDDELARKATAWAQQMAATGQLAHSQLTANVSPGWRTLGENVGAGASVAEVHNGFMNSPEHRRAILSRGYSAMGIGVAEVGGTYWVVQVFKS